MKIPEFSIGNFGNELHAFYYGGGVICVARLLDASLVILTLLYISCIRGVLFIGVGMVNIYLVSNVTGGKFFGDRNQVIAIGDSLVSRFRGRGYEIKLSEVDWHDSNKLLSNLTDSKDHSIIVTSGDHGIEFISLLGDKGVLSDKITTVWSGHHTFVQLMSVNLDYFNFIAIPEYSLKAELRDKVNSVSSVVSVPTIPMVVNHLENQLAYEKFSMQALIPESAKYIVVFVGGDAPDEDGVVHKITEAEIRNFAAYTAYIATNENAKIIVTNNPRTTTAQMDIFLDALHEYKTETAYFDFNAGVRAYKPLLHLLESTPSIAIISGESTSMVDEIVYITGKPAYVVKLSSMNNGHVAHVEYEESLGNIAVIDASEFDQESVHSLRESIACRETATELIAGAVYHHIDPSYCGN